MVLLVHRLAMYLYLEMNYSLTQYTPEHYHYLQRPIDMDA